MAVSPVPVSGGWWRVARHQGSMSLAELKVDASG